MDNAPSTCASAATASKRLRMTSISRTIDGQAQRRESRNALIAARQALPAPQRQAADAAIAAGVDALLATRSPGVLAVYWPIRGEPDLRDALPRWQAAGWALALPSVAAPGQPLVFGRWQPGMALRRERFDVAVPEPFEPVRPDCLLVPCVGFDRRGYRLGYGGGFYDRTLAALEAAFAIGVCHDLGEVAAFEPHQHDRPMNAIVTETRTLRP